jgi:endonuclease-3
MNEKLWAKKIAKILDEHFPSPPIPLQHKDAYTLLIAVLLSAQCTDDRVNKVTPPLFAKASSPKEMVKLPVEDIQELIRSCGLSKRKAESIWQLSKILIDKYHGKVPASFEELEELPGVGHKTASVVMSQAFNQPAMAVDTHIHRCAKRWGLSSGKSVEQTEKDLKRLFPKKSWNKLHLQIIYFGRAFCPARSHDPAKCPICRELLGSGLIV